MESEIRPSKGAIIHDFRSNVSSVQRGGSFILSWNVEADKIDLYRNGAFFQTLGTSQQSLEKSEFYDSDKDVTFELVATKNGIQARSKPIVIKCAATSTAIPHPDFSNHLVKTIPWANFLAISGLIIMFMAIIASLIAGSFNSVMYVSIIPALILLLPYVFLLRFTSKIKRAFAKNEDNTWSEAFNNLRLFFKWMGITIIILVLSVIIGLIVAMALQ